MARSMFGALRDFDRRRPSFPGEHMLTLGAGTALLRSSRRRSSRIGRLLTAAAGLALMARALSGRDGVRRLMRR